MGDTPLVRHKKINSCIAMSWTPMMLARNNHQQHGCEEREIRNPAAMAKALPKSARQKKFFDGKITLFPSKASGTGLIGEKSL